MSQSSSASHNAPPRLRFRVPPQPSHLLRARERLRDYLRQYCTEREVIDDVVLCVEEACTNAIRHSGAAQDIEIALRFTQTKLLATVKDRGRGFDIASFDPQLPADPSSERGRGLVIIAALTDSLELRLDGGLEVRMARNAAPRCEPAALETGLGEPRDTSPLDHRDTRTRAMLEEIDEGFIALDWEYRLVHANEAALRMAGKPLEELSGATLWNIFPTMTESPLGEALGAAMELGRPSVIEYQTQLSGTWLEARIYPTPVGVSAYFREINERKRIEQEARVARAELEATLAAITDGFYTLDREWRVTYLNDKAAAAFPGGKTALHASFWELFPEAAGSAFETNKRAAMEQGEFRAFESYYPPFDAWFEERDYPSADGITVLFTDVSERKRAEQALRDAEQKSQDLVRYAPTGIYEIDFRGPCFKTVNDAMCALSGYTREELLAMNPSDLLDAESQAVFAERLRKGLAGESIPDSVDYRFKTKDGRLRDVVLNTTFTETDGVIDGALVVGHDITERKQAEEAVRESEERFRLLHDTMLQGVVYQDADGTIISMNPVAERILGKPPQDFLGSSSVGEEHDTLREDGSPFPGLEHPAMVALRTGEPVPDVLMQVYNPRESRYRLINIQAVPLFRPGEDKPYRVYAVFDDVTERKQAEEALRASEERFRLALRNAPVSVSAQDRGLRYVWAYNQRSARPEQIIGKLDTDIFTPEEAERLVGIKRRVLDEGVEIHEQMWLKRPGGRMFLDVTFEPIRDEGDRVVGVGTATVDLTPMKLAEEALRENEENLRTVLENSQDGINMLDLATGRYLLLSPAQLEMTGFSEEELRGITAEEAYERVHPDDREVSITQQERIAAGEDLEEPVEYRWKVKSGEYRWFSDRRKLVRDAEGRPVALVGVSRDITESKRAEETRELLARESAAEHAQLRTVLETMTDGLVISDADTNVLHMNPEALRLLGFDDVEQIRRGLAEWPELEPYTLDGRPLRLEDSALARVTRGETFKDYEYEVRNRTTGTAWIGNFGGAPIRDQTGRVILTVLTIRDVTERRHAEEDRQRLLDQSLVQAEEVRKVQEQLRQELETTVLLSEAAGSLSRSLALNEVLDRLARIVLDKGGHARVTISLWQERTGLLEVVSALGEPIVPIGLLVALDELSEPAREAINERRSTLIDYDALEPGRRGVGDRVTSHLAFNVPLLFGDRLVGLLATDDPGEHREFSTRERTLIEGIAAQAAVAIENAQLYEAKRAELARTSVMKEIAAAAASSLEPAQLSERALTIARELLEAEIGSVYLLDQSGQRALHVAHFGYPPQSAEELHRVAIDDHTLTGRAMLTGELQIAGVSSYPEGTEEHVRALGLDAHRMIAIPVRARGTVVGVVALGFLGQRPFSDDELGLYRAVAEQIGVSLDSARLFAEQQRIAETLQENFIHELPTVAGLDLGVAAQTAFAPELVGGDFRDVFALDDTHVVILIGDVAGKGVRAAGYTETVRSKVRAFASIDSSPAFILGKTNELMVKLDSDEPHVTAFCAVLNPATGHLSYASAGHPAPVHLGPFMCRPLDVRFGPPLGSFARPYSEAHTMLTLEDCLVLYTDGVTEARRDREMYGETRLVETIASLRGLAAQELAEGILQDVGTYADRLTDDIQIVVLRLD